MDELVLRVARHGDDAELLGILEELCALTDMGFAAVAQVTADRWIACQVLDRIDFGMTPGGELEVATTICDDIRRTQRRVVIDHVAEDRDWATHPTPILYGFQSYVSIPLALADGSFFGTLCAIDPRPRLLNTSVKIAAIEALARRAEAVLSRRVGQDEAFES